MEAGPPGEPVPDQRRLVGGVVAGNQVHVQLGGHLGLDSIERLAELQGPVAAVALANHLTGPGVQSGEEGRGAVAHVIMGAPLGLARTQGQKRPGAVQGLDLGLLVHAQDQRPVRRVEVEPHNIPHLLDEEGVRRQLEGLGAVGLQREGTPDAAHGVVAQTGTPGHGPGAPVGGVLGGGLQGQRNHPLNVGIVNHPGTTAARLVQQAVQPTGITSVRKLARSFLLLIPVGVVLGILFASQLSLLSGAAVAFLLIGISMLLAGYLAWKDDGMVAKADQELPTFLRSLGIVAGASGVTLTEALKRIDVKSMDSLEPHIKRLQVRLGAGLPTAECWGRFRGETGSELVARTTQMLADGSEFGGRPDQVGEIVGNYASHVVQLRAKRQLTSSTFSFLTVPMHATMTFILVFILEIIINFNAKLAEAAGGAAGVREISVPEGLTVPPGVAIPAAGELSGGLDLFGNQDMTLVTQTIVLVIVILTVANSLAPKFAAGGSNLKIVSFLGIMSIVSGVVLGIVPVITSELFSI